MVKHIVAWRLRKEPSVRANAERVKGLLEGMAGRIPGLLRIEVGINFLDDANAADVVLYSEFEDREALLGYQVHPVHEAVKPAIRELTVERRVVDYET
ncbi:MAG: Dabb family protein [Steroidobacteraceae bacterium]|jgi:quinol monooxygenase YgiN|nr:Dabb family protein [Steroidobacteraceae bacterium]